MSSRRHAPATPPAVSPVLPPTPAVSTSPVAAVSTSPGAAVDDRVAALRAQILATEHWSLLATRSMTWSEVMSRITIHLTVTSAALVVLALVAQATGFGQPFRLLSLGLSSAVLVLGTLTGMRVMNASQDDAALVVGMNRLRAGYAELDPGVARYLVTSAHDDQAGLLATYRMGMRRSTLSHVLASTAMFINVVNAIVAGTFGALVTEASGGTVALVAAMGALTGVAYLVVMLEIGRRTFGDDPIDAQFPSPPAPRS